MRPEFRPVRPERLCRRTKHDVSQDPCGSEFVKRYAPVGKLLGLLGGRGSCGDAPDFESTCRDKERAERVEESACLEVTAVISDIEHDLARRVKRPRIRAWIMNIQEEGFVLESSQRRLDLLGIAIGEELVRSRQIGEELGVIRVHRCQFASKDAEMFYLQVV